MDLHKFLLISIIVMVIAGGFLTVGYIWIPGLSGTLYFKLMGTLGVLSLLAALVMVLKLDLGQHKNLKDNNYID